MTVEGNRITSPVTPANEALDKQLAPISPTGQAVLTIPPWVGLILACIGVLAAAVPSLLASGISLPIWAAPVASAIGSLLAVLGVNSAGARRN